MNPDFTYFLLSTFTAALLAVQLTGFWWKHRQRQQIGFWVCAFWLLAIADLLFLLSSSSGLSIPRILPRTLITAAYGFIFLASQCTAGTKPRIILVTAITLGYAACLAFLSGTSADSQYRVIISRTLWTAFCLLGAFELRKAGKHYSGSLGSPATVLFLQAAYMLLRSIAVALLPSEFVNGPGAILVYIDYINTALFDVALCVAILLALVEVRNAEALASQTEVQTLSNFLPVCAWCRKVRDDEGYWHEIMEYCTHKSRFKVTHGICVSCAEKLNKE